MLGLPINCLINIFLTHSWKSEKNFNMLQFVAPKQFPCGAIRISMRTEIVSVQVEVENLTLLWPQSNLPVILLDYFGGGQTENKRQAEIKIMTTIADLSHFIAAWVLTNAAPYNSLPSYIYIYILFLAIYVLSPIVA